MITYTTPPCILCHQHSSVEVDEDDLRRWVQGELIQRVWPDRSANWRELMMTGTHPNCWDRMIRYGAAEPLWEDGRPE